ncbi:MAG: hypothetical protein ACJ71B_04350 [Nitrososphaera sp.]|jgi:hypothetical protein
MNLYGRITFVEELEAYILFVGGLFIITISLIYGASLSNMLVGPVA